MSDRTKKIIVIGLNLIFGAVLGLAPELGWDLGWYAPITMIIAIGLDTWAGIEWIPPKKQV